MTWLLKFWYLVSHRLIPWASAPALSALIQLLGHWLLTDLFNVKDFKLKCSLFLLWQTQNQVSVVGLVENYWPLTGKQFVAVKRGRKGSEFKWIWWRHSKASISFQPSTAVLVSEVHLQLPALHASCTAEWLMLKCLSEKGLVWQAGATTSAKVVYLKRH